MFQIIRIINLCTEAVLYIQRTDQTLIRYFIERIFCITGSFLPLAKRFNPVKPDLPVLFFQLIEGLGCHRILKKLNADFFNAIVMNDSFEIFLRQRNRRTDGHAAVLTCQYLVKNPIFKDQISMHKQKIVIFQFLSCTIDGINIVGLIIDRIFYKCIGKGQIQALAVLFQHLIKESCGHNHFLNSCLCNLVQLTT